MAEKYPLPSGDISRGPSDYSPPSYNYNGYTILEMDHYKHDRKKQMEAFVATGTIPRPSLTSSSTSLSGPDEDRDTVGPLHSIPRSSSAASFKPVFPHTPPNETDDTIMYGGAMGRRRSSVTSIAGPRESNDLSLSDNLNENTIIYTLKKRFEEQIIYVSTL